MFPKTDKIPWICFRERAGTKNTDMTFIHEAAEKVLDIAISN